MVRANVHCNEEILTFVHIGIMDLLCAESALQTTFPHINHTHVHVHIATFINP